ncbi:MAG: serine/threonine-protein kinase [Deltaproteobacteria bacterium]|nr:serine/threonine-protein kinase [Deltaproteobacteria bacterium]
MNSSNSQETLPAPGAETLRTATPSSAIARGQQLARYVVIEEIGRGSMGVVYAAYDPKLDRKVALKALLGGDAARLLREAQALARLSHPNVVAVHDVGVDEGRVFLAMEFVDGSTVDQWLQQQTRDWQSIVDVFIAAARGLAAAHAARIVHRDFKPANAMMTASGVVKVTDFGLARDAGDPTRGTEDSEGELPGQLDIQLTASGAMVGTPLFMSPEQHGGERATEASDQFSLCCALYQAVYRQRPVEAEDLNALRASVILGELRPPPPTPGVPAVLGRVVMRGLSVQPADRFPSMNALIAELTRLRARRQRRFVTAGALVLGGALSAAVVLRASAPTPCDGVDRIPAWTAASRAQIAQAFAAVDSQYATAAGEHVLPALDDYVERWGTLRREACHTAHATTVRIEPPVELRIACLERRRDAVSVAVEVMMNADEQVAADASHLVERLPALELCADPDVALLDAQPASPQTRTAVARLRVRMRRAEAMRFAGDSRRSLATLTTLLDEALDLGYDPLIAEIRLSRAAAMENVGQLPESGAEAEAAYIAASISGARLLATKAISMLIVLHAEGLSDPGRGKTWVRLGEGWVPQLSDHPWYSAQVVGSLAIYASRHRDYDKALDYAHRAIATAEQTGSFELITRSKTNLAVVLNRAGRLQESIDTFEEVRREQSERLGEDHPEVANTLVRLTAVYEGIGRYDEGLRAGEWAVEIREHHRYDPLHLGHALQNVANSYYSQNRQQEAYAAAVRSMDEFDRVIEGDHRFVAIGLNNLGNYADILGRGQEAIDYYERAIAMRRRLGEDPGDLIAPLTNLATTYGSHGNKERGLQVLQDAWALAQSELPAGHPTRAFVEAVLGEALRSMGRYDEAYLHLTTALPLLEAKLDARAEIIVSTLQSLAKTQRERGEPLLAIATFQRALDGDDLTPAERGRGLFYLSKAQWDAGRHSQARASATEAAAALEEAGKADDMAQVQQWLREHADR